MNASSHQTPGALPPLVPVPANPMAAAVAGHRAAQDQAQPAATTANEVTAYVAQVVEAIAEAPTALARATLHAELEQAAEDRECLEWFHGRLLETAPLYAGCAAVRRLCEGRPPTHHLSVETILAALDGHAPASRPVTLAWDGTVALPAGDRPGEKTLIPLKTAMDGSAVLELDDAQRLALAANLAISGRAVLGCATPGCGKSPGELAAARRPVPLGWVLIDVAGGVHGPRWWCSAFCAGVGVSTAGVEIAAADRAAATDPRQQAPNPPAPDTLEGQAAAEDLGPLYGGDVAQFISDAYDSLADQDADEVARCHRCGCTEEQACEGGCHWVPNLQLIDLCSRCATPEELAAAEWKPAAIEDEDGAQ